MRKIDSLELFLTEEINDDELKKIYKNYIKNKKNPISYNEFIKRIEFGGILTGGTTAAIIGKQSKEMITGRKIVYHGTVNNKNNRIDAIYKNGFSTSFGGSNISIKDAENAKNGLYGGALKNADEKSKGTIHFTTNKEHAKCYIRPGYSPDDFPENKRVIYKINMPYEQYIKSKNDEKISDGINHYIKNKKISDFSTEIFTGAKTTDTDINRAAIVGNKYVNKQEKKEYDEEQFKNYYKNHKKRFAAGVGLGVGAAALTGLAAYNAYKLIKSEKERRKAYEDYIYKGGKADYKTFCNTVFNECLNIIINEELDLSEEQYNKYKNNCIQNGKKYLPFEEWYEKKNNKNIFNGIAGIASGGAIIYGSKGMLTGKKKVYHGTSMDHWKEIKKGGMLTSSGGTGGAGDAIKDINNNLGNHLNNASKGKVYATASKFYATKYANIQDNPQRFGVSYKDKSKKDNILQYIKKPGKNGKVITINMDYEKFYQGEVDPDSKFYGRPLKDNSLFDKNYAFRTPYDITPEEIVGSNATKNEIKKHNKINFNDYIKKHPERFAGGIAATAIGIGAASYGGYKLYKYLKNKKDKNKKLSLKEEYLLNELIEIYEWM